MSAYLLRKLVMVVPTILGTTLVVFIGLRVVPGDPARMMIGESGTQQDYLRLRAELGLDDPLYVQYAGFLVHSLEGDFGRSLRTQEQAITLIGQSLPSTIELAVSSLIIACLLGIGTGIAAAVRQYSLFDNLLMVLVLLGVSMPTFWTGLLAILIFSVHFGLFPVGGALSDGITLQRITGMVVVDSLIEGNPAALKDAVLHLILPAVTLAAVPLAVIARMMRSAMLEVLHQDYVVTARGKGLAERAVILRHALRNSLIPVLTVVGLQLGYLLSGAVVTETIFARPGLGRLAISSISFRDYPVVQGIVLLTVLVFVTVNLFVDVLYAYLDPQIRYG